MFCAVACILVHILFGLKSFFGGGIPAWRTAVDLVILFVCILFTQYIFRKFWKVDEKKIRRLWLEVKNDEQNSAAGCLKD